MSDPTRLMNDISDYQTIFDPFRYKRAGHKVIMIKAVEGNGHPGAMLHQARAKAAHAAGLRVVHYGFLRELNGLEQARALLDACHGSSEVWRQGDVLCADVEDENFNTNTAITITREWAEELRRNRHPEPVGYSGRSYLTERAGLAKTIPHGWIIADYGIFKAPNLGDYRACKGSVCLGRQFTDGQLGPNPHMASGISGAVDCSWLTKAGMQKLAGIQPTRKLVRRKMRRC